MRLLPWACIAVAIGLVVYLCFEDKQRVDEATHLAIGLEYLSTGTYQYERLHPPLARIWAALPSYAMGARMPEARCSQSFSKWYSEIERLHSGGFFPSYCLTGNFDTSFVDRTMLVSGRLMMIPVYVLALIGIYWLAREMHIEHDAALWSAACFALVPMVVQMAGNIMTDLMVTCWAILTLLMLLRLFHRGGVVYALLLGVCAGLALLSKFSAGYFLPPVCLVWLVLSWRHLSYPITTLAHLALAAAMALLVWLAGYGFSTDAIYEGLQMASLKAEKGHAGFLVQGGEEHMGSWYFYPALLLIRTPLTFLLFAIAGGYWLIRQRHSSGVYLLLAASLILLLAIPTQVNINLHHILLIYAPLAILMGVGAVWLMRRHSPVLIIASLCLMLEIGINNAEHRFLLYENLAF